MHGVAEVSDVDEPNCDADERDDFGELLAELVQLLLQRRLLLLRARHLVTDLADLGGDASADHDTDGSARSDVGALNENVHRNKSPISHTHSSKIALSTTYTHTLPAAFISW